MWSLVGSTVIADLNVPNMYLPRNYSAMFLTFLRSSSRCDVVFIGVLLDSSKGDESMCIVWIT